MPSTNDHESDDDIFPVGFDDFPQEHPWKPIPPVVAGDSAHGSLQTPQFPVAHAGSGYTLNEGLATMDFEASGPTGLHYDHPNSYDGPNRTPPTEGYLAPPLERHLSYEIASTRAGPPMDAPKSTLVDRTKPSGSRSHNPMPKKPPPRSQPPPRVATLLDSEAEAPEMPNLEMTDMRFEPVMKSTVLRYMYHVSVDGPALAVPTSVEDTTQSTNLAKLAYRESAKEFPNAPEEATNKVALIIITRAARINTLQIKHIRTRFDSDWSVMPHTSLGFVPGSVEELNYAKEKIVSYTTKLNFLNAEKFCILLAVSGMYPIFNHPSLMNGFNEWIWNASGLGAAFPKYYRQSAYNHMLALYVAGVVHGFDCKMFLLCGGNPKKLPQFNFIQYHAPYKAFLKQVEMIMRDGKARLELIKHFQTWGMKGYAARHNVLITKTKAGKTDLPARPSYEMDIDISCLP